LKNHLEYLEMQKKFEGYFYDLDKTNPEKDIKNKDNDNDNDNIHNLVQKELEMEKQDIYDNEKEK
jgi:hypothetical protein